ncbi:sugar phosphate isomerase/epimerase [Salinibacter ruber]|uniref:sugar phosphate isomerase/epimerase family protein n=1 Tax=Salinibacter ruber TaxID=146919 RepID=UPI00216A8F32|nr:sugar phosphate isomerase/epimerase family protein [Salinibacter ruber]MCS3665473.1 sugar phosphate isomerase/epimerase [Salinibacter ruber]
MLRFAYNTNGASNHRLEDALGLIADSGYDGVALTLDHHHFDPFAPRLDHRASKLSSRLDKLGLDLVVETGARFLLNPREKHEPTLIHPTEDGRDRRIEFLTRALDVAAICDGEAVSFWAGRPQEGVGVDEAWSWLVEGVGQVVEAAEERGVTPAFEPEPGMLVETVGDFYRLQDQVSGLRLALDTGHCLVTEERAPQAAVRECESDLGTVAIEDMKRGIHEHLFFGEGDMDIPAILDALEEVGFGRLVCVELSRASPTAHETVPDALDYLRSAERVSPDA